MVHWFVRCPLGRGFTLTCRLVSPCNLSSHFAGSMMELMGVERGITLLDLISGNSILWQFRHRCAIGSPLGTCTFLPFHAELTSTPPVIASPRTTCDARAIQGRPPARAVVHARTSHWTVRRLRMLADEGRRGGDGWICAGLRGWGNKGISILKIDIGVIDVPCSII